MNKILAAYDKEPPAIHIECYPRFPLEPEMAKRATKLGLKNLLLYQSGTPHWENLRQLWNKALYIHPGIEKLEWKEELLTLADVQQSLHSADLQHIVFQGYKTDSFTVQAQRRGLFPESHEYLQSVVMGILEEKGGENILLGVRNEKHKPAKLILPPAGAVAYPTSAAQDNILENALTQELAEETGILLSETVSSHLIGITCPNEDSAQGQQFAYRSNLFLYRITLLTEMEEIISRHQRAFQTYQQTKQTSSGDEIEKEIYAREKLREMAQHDKHFPADVWEHTSLFRFPIREKSIVNDLALLVEERPLQDSTYGALALYILSKFGEATFQEILRIPCFQENVQDRRIAIQP